MMKYFWAEEVILKFCKKSLLCAILFDPVTFSLQRELTVERTFASS